MCRLSPIVTFPLARRFVGVGILGAFTCSLVSSEFPSRFWRSFAMPQFLAFHPTWTFAVSRLALGACISLTGFRARRYAGNFWVYFSAPPVVLPSFRHNTCVLAVDRGNGRVPCLRRAQDQGMSGRRGVVPLHRLRLAWCGLHGGVRLRAWTPGFFRLWAVGTPTALPPSRARFARAWSRPANVKSW